MSPRIPAFTCLRSAIACQSSTTSRSFSSTPPSQAYKVKPKRKHRDPYAVAQARARKTANLSRQEVLLQERNAALGDPVRGITTPFLESLDTGIAPAPADAFETSSGRSTSSLEAETEKHLNFYVSQTELDEAIERGKWMTSPVVSDVDSESSDTPKMTAADVKNNTTPQIRAVKLDQDQRNAEEALKRISSLSLGSSKDRLRLNTQRIIDTFGRHNTDKSLPPKPKSAVTGDQSEKTARVGPDTGSSEVQIGILTAKIRTLADFLQSRGPMDKVNKRNLRLLVHRRAKLLKYLRRKERGGPRWQNLIETLGLTEGTWQGEITLR